MNRYQKQKRSVTMHRSVVLFISLNCSLYSCDHATAERNLVGTNKLKILQNLKHVVFTLDC